MHPVGKQAQGRLIGVEVHPWCDYSSPRSFFFFFFKLKYNEIPRPPTAINMTGWLEAGAITEQAWALVQGLGFSWERLPLCDAGGCRGIRGWEGPPRDRGCLARGRG